MWVRGLKHEGIQNSSNVRKSHPMWVRGLKLHHNGYEPNRIVAPYVGAWIETLSFCCWSFFFVSHPMWVRGLKHL